MQRCVSGHVVQLDAQGGGLVVDVRVVHRGDGGGEPVTFTTAGRRVGIIDQRGASGGALQVDQDVALHHVVGTGHRGLQLVPGGGAGDSEIAHHRRDALGHGGTAILHGDAVVERIDIDEALVLNGRHHDGGVAASDVDVTTGQFDRRSKGHLGIGDGGRVGGIDQAQQVGKAAAGTVYCLVKSHEALRYENVLDPRESGQVSVFDVPRQISKRKPK